MKRIIGLAAIAACALACSAAPEDYEEALELATEKQPYIALNSASKQFGTQTGSTKLSCNKTSSGQVCSIPRTKKIQIVRDNTGTWSSAELIHLQSLRGALASVFPTWTFTSIVTPTDPADPSAVRVFVINNTVGGASSNNIDQYRSVSFGSTSSLTEGGGGGLPAGNYQSHGNCTVTIDRLKILAKGANANEDSRLFYHAAGNGFLACMGVGTNSSANGKLSQRPINMSIFLDTATSGEVCRADFSDLTDTADFSIQTASACAGD